MNIYRLIENDDGTETFQRMPKKQRFDDDKRDRRAKKDRQERRQERTERYASFA